MFNIKKIAYILIALLLATGISSCGGGGAGDVAESGELVVIEDNSDIRLGVYDVDTLNPLETKSESVRKVMNIIYEPLFDRAEDMSAEAVLAESFTVADGGRQITVKLKDGVKWQDGTVFSAEDVAYTLSKMRTSGGSYRKTADKIRSFTAVDKTRIVINFDKPQPNPELLLMFPIISKNTPYKTDSDFAPMGTGAYKLSAKNSTEILLEANSIWHKGIADGKKITVKILKNREAAAEAFGVNGADAITSDELVSGAAPKTNSRTETLVSDNMVFLGFNVKSAALEPTAVRKAIAGLLDKEKILENDAYGHGKAADSAVNPSSWAYSPREAEDEDYAETLIMNEGYALNAGVYYRDGAPLSVRLLVNSDNSGRSALADSIADTLRAAGFSVTVEKTAYDEYVSKIAADDFDMFIGETEVEPNLNPATMTDAENYFNIDAEFFASAKEKLTAAGSREEYKKAAADFMRTFYSNPPYVPLYFRTKSVIYGSYVSGTEKPSLYNPYKSIEKWYFYGKDASGENGEESDE